MKFYRNDKIEEIAEKRLLEFERELGQPLSLPVPVDLFGEMVLKLDLLWEGIDEFPGEFILGGIVPENRRVVLNENRRGEMEEKPGLERFTLGHEFGHWDLFVDKATLRHPGLFGDEEKGAFAYRSSVVGEVAIIKKLEGSPEGRKLLKEIAGRADEPDEARSVNRYAASILMPRSLVREEVSKIDQTQWPELYRLKDKFGVTISSLRVRLEQLGLLYIKGDTPYESRDAAVGRRRCSESAGGPSYFFRTRLELSLNTIRSSI